MKQFLAFTPQYGLHRLGDATNPLDAYNASPLSGVMGLVADGFLLTAAWYLWGHNHKGWGTVLGLLGIGGVGYNLYKLTSPSTSDMPDAPGTQNTLDFNANLQPVPMSLPGQS